MIGREKRGKLKRKIMDKKKMVHGRKRKTERN